MAFQPVRDKQTFVVVGGTNKVITNGTWSICGVVYPTGIYARYEQGAVMTYTKDSPSSLELVTRTPGLYSIEGNFECNIGSGSVVTRFNYEPLNVDTGVRYGDFWYPVAASGRVHIPPKLFTVSPAVAGDVLTSYLFPWINNQTGSTMTISTWEWVFRYLGPVV